ncbi:MAG: DNA topoisomerase (ATP-hydrolyzing) subunit A [Candidatus Ornithospirochaeta sp.]|nr:DNA topoisomerase (ATP-hydrolyzing) subunit A [Candidatus Ornithospirochaeta sp.]
MSEVINEDQMGIIETHDLSEEMKVSYLNYAMSVIVSRALPDARDGLKPVHRRILYAMWDMGLKANAPTKKCARVVGDVLGKYHPHGDASVYDALVRLGQDFSLRYPVVRPQGNFGSIDGDPPAAMRYTEAKLSKLGEEMLADIGKETVDFMNNYDESLKEPVVLPAAFPFLLVNGSSGIAVGMATNMAPHNLREVIEGINAYIDNPDITIEGLMEFVKGPDFPSYGRIMGRSGISEAFRTGKGKIVIRSTYTIEEHDKGRDKIIFTEIPYQVNKSELVKKIDDLRKSDDLKDVAAVRDESGRDGIRIVIELKQGAVAQIVLNQLWGRTALQSNFNIYNLALVNGVPKLMNLRDMISVYVDHRKEVVERRTRYDLRKAEEREHILYGLKIGLDNIDEVIRIIKESQDNTIASLELQKAFNLDQIQADAIIDMKLGRLSHLETEKILQELSDLEEKIAYYKDLLSDVNKILGVVKDELNRIKDAYGDNRRTVIDVNEIKDNNPGDFIKKEDVVVSITNKGFAKRLSVDEYQAQGRGGKGTIGAKLVDGDFVNHLFICHSHDYMMFITNKGKAYYVKAYDIPESAKTSKGVSVKSLVQIENDEKITSIISFQDFNYFSKKKEDEGELENEYLDKPDEDAIYDDNGNKIKYILMGTKNGVVKKVRLNAFINAKVKGVKAIILDEGDELADSIFVDEDDDVMLITKDGKGLRTSAASIRTMGRSTHGVRGIKLMDEDILVSIVKVDDSKTVLMVTEKGKGKKVAFSDFMNHGRGTMGQKIYTIEKGENGIVDAFAVDDDTDVVIMTLKGQVMRIHTKGISLQGRSARGVKVAAFKRENDAINAMAVTSYQEDEPESPSEDSAE